MRSREELAAENKKLKRQIMALRTLTEKKIRAMQKELDMQESFAYHKGVTGVRQALVEGGKKGGKNRWNGMTKEERSEVARKAARARWSVEKPVETVDSGPETDGN